MVDRVPVVYLGETIGEVVGGPQKFLVSFKTGPNANLLRVSIREKSSAWLGYDIEDYIKEQLSLPVRPDFIYLVSNIPAVQSRHDPVNHPEHYTSHPSGVECIEVVRHMGFNLGNVVKYIWRAGIKDAEVELQDLEKAAWYLQDEIKMRKDAK